MTQATWSDIVKAQNSLNEQQCLKYMKKLVTKYGDAIKPTIEEKIETLHEIGVLI